MSRLPAVWSDARSHLRTTQPDCPVLYFHPDRLAATARRFLTGFPGLVTYAIKSNDHPSVVDTLIAAGISGFDVASPSEMEMVRAASSSAVMHYNNPVRSLSEIRRALALGVRSYSIDDMGELEKLAEIVPAEGVEISVRLKLPLKGGIYDFGAKFGALPDPCVALLKRVAELGFTPSMTFHPGTQCEDGAAWVAYIGTCADIARQAGVTLSRLNVGGGFPGHRTGEAPDLEAIFSQIAGAVERHFGDAVPDLVCEPGRALCGEAFTLATRVKSLREGGVVYLNDGIYGGLAEAPLLGCVDRIKAYSSNGDPREGETFDAVVFGPTCDSLDVLKDTIALPKTLEEEDFILFDGMGAYSTATATRFNGYGAFEIVTLGADL